VSPRLAGQRVLILGAETEIGRAVTTAVAEVGASVAAVAAASDAEAAFAVQRLARGLSAERKVIAQAIDATNEAAVRVMVRQVSKELGGLDAVVLVTTEAARQREFSMDLARQYGGRELSRGGGGKLVIVWSMPATKPGEPVSGPAFKMELRPPDVRPDEWTRGQNWTATFLQYAETMLSRAAADVVAAIAGEPDSG